MTETATSPPVLLGCHALIRIGEDCVTWEICVDEAPKWTGIVPYGDYAAGGGGCFTVQSAWRAVERELTRRQVEATEVRDERSAPEAGAP